MIAVRRDRRSRRQTTHTPCRRSGRQALVEGVEARLVRVRREPDLDAGARAAAPDVVDDELGQVGSQVARPLEAADPRVDQRCRAFHARHGSAHALRARVARVRCS